MGSESQKLLLSKRQAAKLLGVSISRTLNLMIEDGSIRLVPFRKGYRIPLADIERLTADGWVPKNAEKPIRKRKTKIQTESLTSWDQIRL